MRYGIDRTQDIEALATTRGFDENSAERPQVTKKRT